MHYPLVSYAKSSPHLKSLKVSFDLKKYKKLLLARQEELTLLISDTKENSATVELDQTSVGRLSRMDAMQGQAMAEAVKGRRDLELARIDAALTRITEDEYGYCLNCGDDIDKKRLDLDASIALCNKCAV
ncbi:MAG: TraR/DksA family transcriptional regulator [Kordiimonadaceae bacterium]|nr:TraR/DksA family transcriptional regulator [Kordiimonadaceae bacterium]MBT6328529.1 TraR/DksA family transcriptional regulator [Kordiimonadaceae bacterium]